VEDADTRVVISQWLQLQSDRSMLARPNGLGGRSSHKGCRFAACGFGAPFSYHVQKGGDNCELTPSTGQL